MDRVPFVKLHGRFLRALGHLRGNGFEHLELPLFLRCRVLREGRAETAGIGFKLGRRHAIGALHMRQHLDPLVEQPERLGGLRFTARRAELQPGLDFREAGRIDVETLIEQAAELVGLLARQGRDLVDDLSGLRLAPVPFALHDIRGAEGIHAGEGRGGNIHPHPLVDVAHIIHRALALLAVLSVVKVLVHHGEEFSGAVALAISGHGGLVPFNRPARSGMVTGNARDDAAIRGLDRVLQILHAEPPV